MAVGTYKPVPTVDVDATYSPADVFPPTPVQQSTFARATRKFREEPLVPLGIAATVVALVAASSALQRGNRTQFNKFLRYRVAAQGLTVIAALGGSVYYQRERKEVRDAQREAKGLPAKLESVARPL